MRALLTSALVVCALLGVAPAASAEPAREWQPLSDHANTVLERELVFLKGCLKQCIGASFDEERARVADLDERLGWEAEW